MISSGDTVDCWNPQAKQTVWMVLKPSVNRGIKLPYQQLVRWISEPSTVVTVTDGFSEICRIFLKIFQTSCYVVSPIQARTWRQVMAGYILNFGPVPTRWALRLSQTELWGPYKRPPKGLIHPCKWSDGLPINGQQINSGQQRVYDWPLYIDGVFFHPT